MAQDPNNANGNVNANDNEPNNNDNAQDDIDWNESLPTTNRTLLRFVLNSALIITLFLRFWIISNTCDICGNDWNVEPNRSYYDNNQFKLDYHLYCETCTQKQSLKHDSYMQGSHLSFTDHLQLIYYFYNNRSVKATANDLEMSRATVIKYFKIFRRCLRLKMRDYYKNNKLGYDAVVEIDESAFGKKRKHNRGNNGRIDSNNENDNWVLGFVERRSGRCCMFNVPNRRRDTLVPFIKKFVTEYTHCVTDCWGAYLVLGDSGYYHTAVNHKITFKCPITGEHTNTIEGLWALVKQKSKAMKGINKKYLQDYLDEFAFRRIFAKSSFTLMGEMLYAIGKYWREVGSVENLDYKDFLYDTDDEESED